MITENTVNGENLKPKEYIIKFKLDKPLTPAEKSENITALIKQLDIDLDTELNIGKGTTVYLGFKSAVKRISDKWNGINAKCLESNKFTEKTWKYFYATIVIPKRQKYFPNIIEENKKKYEQRKKEKAMLK